MKNVRCFLAVNMTVIIFLLFDNIEDYELIKRRLNLIREYTDVFPKFYVFCGFDRNNKWIMIFGFKIFLIL